MLNFIHLLRQFSQRPLIRLIVMAFGVVLFAGALRVSLEPSRLAAPVAQVAMLIGTIYLWMRAQTEMAQAARRASLGGVREVTVDTKVEVQSQVSFANIAGCSDAVAELRELVDMLKNQDRYLAMGARQVKGVMLSGPPGTGKTLLAKAVAGECGLPFLFNDNPGFSNKYVGVGAENVRMLFATARRHKQGCIIFLDEIDAVGKQRSMSDHGGEDERNNTLNQMLIEMDGMRPTERILVIAATNRPEILDQALLRPGRFDRKVTVMPPDKEGRKEILRVHTANKPLGPDVDLDEIARRTYGFVGADLENVCNEAAILAAREHSDSVCQRHLDAGIERAILGIQQQRTGIQPEDRRVIAVHEAGHAVAARHCGDHSVEKITIASRGNTLGFVLKSDAKVRALHTRESLLDELIVLLAGRAAERTVLGAITTGAENDIERVTHIAESMVTRWGMSERFPNMRFDEQAIPLNEHLQEEVRAIIDTAWQSALGLCKQKQAAVERVAQELIEQETLTGTELDHLLA